MKWEKEINEAVQVIDNGGNILCPTDTIWGLSADATNEQAVEKVFQIKNRPATKSMIVLVSDLKMLQNYVEEIPANAIHLIEKSKTPTTIIYPKGKNLPKNVLAANGSIGIRIVEDDFCQVIIKKLGRAIISTSANLSGEEAPKKYSDISAAIKQNVDYQVRIIEKEVSKNAASSIYLIEGNELKQIR